jgi:hypothetical protein
MCLGQKRVQFVHDLGGEGIAYLDADPINHGSGELNHKREHCEEGVPMAICRFRENEGVDISCVKKGADLNHPSMVVPEWQQLYIGWTDDGEWLNYTVEGKKAGTYRIVATYSHTPQTIQFWLNSKPAADCKLPLDPAKHFRSRTFPIGSCGTSGTKPNAEKSIFLKRAGNSSRSITDTEAISPILTSSPRARKLAPNEPARPRGPVDVGSATSLARLMPTVVPASSFVVSSLSAKGASGLRKGQKST